MKPYLRNGAILLALIGSVGLAAAQQSIQLTPQQRSQVYQMVMKEKPAAPAPAGLSLRIGAKVPVTVALSELPDSVATSMPNLRQYKFVVAQDQVALINPSTNEIVEILRR